MFGFRSYFNGFKPAVLYRQLITVLVFNIPLIFIVLLQNMRSVEFTPLTWFYFTATVVGYYVLPLLVVISLAFLFFFPLKRLAIYPIGAVITIFVFFIIIDSLAYKITRIHIDLFWLEWIMNDFQAFGLSPSTLRNVLLLLLGLIAIEVSFFKFARRIKKPRYLVWTVSLVTVLAFSASQVTHAVAYEKNDIRITSLTPRFPIYYPTTSHKRAKKYSQHFSLGENESGNTAGEHQGALNYPLSNIECNLPPDQKPPNIVMIFLESWRFDMMNESVTPNIHKLSEKSSVFLNHFSTGNSTVAGTFGFFSGLNATYWPAVKANNARIDNPLFIDVLKENNYTFGIFAKSNFKRHKIKDAIFRGIDVQESFAGQTVVERDKDMTRQVVSFIREQQSQQHPYMAFAFYKSNHHHYSYPSEDKIFLPAGDINLMFAEDETDPTEYRNDYMNSTHYVDRLIGEIIQELDSLGEMENTVIAISTDHSDELNDSRANYWGHGSNFTKYQTMVPLVIHLPHRAPSQIEYVTSHSDIAPTILSEYFGCTNDIQDYSSGRNLFDKPTGVRPLVIGGHVNHAFIIEDNVYEIYPLYTKTYKLHDIRAKADPPSPQMLTILIEEMSRFYADSIKESHRQ